MDTGQKIKEARKKAGITQAELAEKVGIPFQSISQWERNVRNPKFESLMKIADALNCDIGELYDFSIQAEQQRKLDQIARIKGRMESASESESEELEAQMGLLQESYDDVDFALSLFSKVQSPPPDGSVGFGLSPAEREIVALFRDNKEFRSMVERIASTYKNAAPEK